MHLTASDLYPYFRPSECRLRVHLKARNEPEDEASPYEAVILRLGERHEAAHIASLGAVVDLRGGTLAERAEATRRALQGPAPSILYHAVLTRVTDIAGQACDIFGEPDVILMEPGSVVIRDCKMAKRVNDDDHPEILRQVELYGWLFQGTTGAAPTRLEVFRGDGTIVDIPYDGGSAAIGALTRVVQARLLTEEPYEPVGWTRCGDCRFNTRCWTRAKERRDVALVVDVDRALAVTLHESGSTSMDELLANFDEATLSTLKRPWGSKMQKVGGRATTILRNAKSLATRSEVLLQPPAVPQSAKYVMFDCEGLPPQLDELDKVYLWGLQVFGEIEGPYHGVTGGFGLDGDRQAWDAFLVRATQILDEYGDIPFIHWAPYERVKIDGYLKRFGADGRADRIKANLVDLFPITRQSVVLPLSSYSLKVVEQYVGYKRQLKEYGGDWAMAKYVEAVELQDEAQRAAIMDEILAYNREDLEATWAVLQWLRQIAASANT
jgi:predicted RecB family nuclease